ncbi:MAG: helix-turn-helix transcriptional regulator, partial [Gammaproteobacteria bacterium]|nr:helix-turn-helix transcriptional regulator [Gammaproteobacteria bacterium]
TTVHNYLHRARMEKACDLLANSELTITQIAMSLGYEYSSNFTTAFRKHFGVTPRQVRTGHTPIAV